VDGFCIDFDFVSCSMKTSTPSLTEDDEDELGDLNLVFYLLVSIFFVSITLSATEFSDKSKLIRIGFIIFVSFKRLVVVCDS